ncbi:MAG: DUF3466 family protein [candidate division Zixibacteria bacterium]|nr:DUF3466 family protein [candidate division Zixibacteria bacterium]
MFNSVHSSWQIFISSLVGLLLLIASGVPVIADQYTIIDLGTLGGSWSGAADINDANVVVGSSAIQSSARRAFIWDGEIMHDLGTPEGYAVSGATAINNSGWITGYTEGEFQSQYAYLYRDEAWEYLGTLPQWDYSVATDINNAGHIIGYSFELGPSGGSLGWLWENGAMSVLGPLGGEDSHASAINDMMEIVGFAQIYDPEDYINHACLWVQDAIIDLGVLPGETKSAASDINDIGQVCGSSSHQQITYPFLTVTVPCLWDDGEIIELELPPGYARGVTTGLNNNGQVIGWMKTSLSGGNSRAFIWEDSVLTNLNSLIPPGSGWVIETASEITDDGKIVGTGEAPNGETHGYMLIPEVTGISESEQQSLPNEYVTVVNYPNPFNNRTNIEYSLPTSSWVRIEVFDILGRKIETLLDTKQAAGNHLTAWDATGHSSGAYYYRLQAGDLSEVRMMTLLK